MTQIIHGTEVPLYTKKYVPLYVSLYRGEFYLFGVLRRFQHCTGHITIGSWKGRGNQYIEFARVPYCKLPTNGKQLPAFLHKALTGIEPRPQRWEARVLPLCHRGPSIRVKYDMWLIIIHPYRGIHKDQKVASPSNQYTS